MKPLRTLDKLLVLLATCLLLATPTRAQRITGTLESIGESNNLEFRGFLGVRNGVLYVLRGLNYYGERKGVQFTPMGSIGARSPLYIIGYTPTLKEVSRVELNIPLPKRQSRVLWNSALLDDSNRVQLYFTAWDEEVPGNVLFTSVFSMEGKILVNTKAIEIISQKVNNNQLLGSRLWILPTQDRSKTLVFRQIYSVLYYLDGLEIGASLGWRRWQFPVGFSYKLLGSGTKRLLTENTISFAATGSRSSVFNALTGPKNEIAVLVQTARKTENGLTTLKQVGSDLAVLVYDAQGKQNLYDLKLGEARLSGGTMAVSPEGNLLVTALFRQQVNDQEQVGLANARVSLETGDILGLDFSLMTDVFPKDPYERDNTEIDFHHLKSLPDGSFLLSGEYEFEDPKFEKNPSAPHVLKDIILVRLNKDLSTRWTRTIPKHQVSISNHQYNSFALLNDTSTAFLLWNDYPENLKSDTPTVPADLDKVKRVATCMAAVDLNTGAVLNRVEAFQTQDLDRFVWANGVVFDELPTDYLIRLTNSRQYKLGWLKFKR